MIERPRLTRANYLWLNKCTKKMSQKKSETEEAEEKKIKKSEVQDIDFWQL